MKNATHLFAITALLVSASTAALANDMHTTNTNDSYVGTARAINNDDVNETNDAIDNNEAVEEISDRSRTRSGRDGDYEGVTPDSRNMDDTAAETDTETNDNSSNVDRNTNTTYTR